MGIEKIDHSNTKLLPKHSPLWNILHTVSKPIIRGLVSQLSSMYHPIIQKKQQEGWINPEIKRLYDNFSEIIQQQEDMGAWTKDNDYNRDLYCGVRDITCVILDEDTHYLLRFFYLLEILHRDYPEYRIEMHKTKAYWNWEKKKMDFIQWGDIKSGLNIHGKNKEEREKTEESNT